MVDFAVVVGGLGVVATAFDEVAGCAVVGAEVGVMVGVTVALGFAATGGAIAAVATSIGVIAEAPSAASARSPDVRATATADEANCWDDVIAVRVLSACAEELAPL